ncbi:hypothetical protein ANTQUA_LOCUS10579 [Anthophora quadrimaculata]
MDLEKKKKHFNQCIFPLLFYRNVQKCSCKCNSFNILHGTTIETCHTQNEDQSTTKGAPRSHSSRFYIVKLFHFREEKVYICQRFRMRNFDTVLLILTAPFFTLLLTRSEGEVRIRSNQKCVNISRAMCQRLENTLRSILEFSVQIKKKGSIKRKEGNKKGVISVPSGV